MDMKKLSRREREKITQRNEMLAAALDLFSNKGYHNVTMHEIAEAAEFAIGTLYKFFKNKEELYKSLCLELSERFDAAIEKALSEGDNELEKLRNYVTAKGRVFQKHVAVIRIYIAETRGASFNIKGGLDNELRERHEVMVKLLASVFEAGMNKKIFKKIAEPYHLAVALDSLTKSFLLLWLESPELQPYPDDPDVILNILLKGLTDP